MKENKVMGNLVIWRLFLLTMGLLVLNTIPLIVAFIIQLDVMIGITLGIELGLSIVAFALAQVNNEEIEQDEYDAKRANDGSNR